MATDAIVSEDNQTSRKMRANDDGSHTPYVWVDPASGGGGSGGGGDVNLNEVGGAAFGLGQALKAASLPVTIASDQEDLVIPFTTSASGAQSLLNNTPTAGFSKVQLIFTAVGVGLTATVQFSPNSGGIYITPLTFTTRLSASGTPAASGVTVSTPYESPVIAPYLKLNISALASGTVSGYIILSNKPMVYSGIIAIPTGTYTTAGAKTNNSVVPSNTNLGVLPAVANAAAPALTETFQTALSTDLNGNTRATLGTKLDPINDLITIAGGLMPVATALNTYSAHITTATTNTPTASTAYISSITIGATAGGAGSTVTIKDKSATPLVLVNALPTATASTMPTVINFQTPIKMTSGIDIVTASGTPATVDVWIDYYQ